MPRHLRPVRQMHPRLPRPQRGEGPVTTANELTPILPEWMRTKAGVTSTVGGAAKRGAHSTVRHTVWSPWYVITLVAYSPRGTWRALWAAWRVIFDLESRPLRLHHIDRTETKEFLAVERVRKDKIHNRLIVAAVITAVSLIALTVAWFLVPDWG